MEAISTGNNLQIEELLLKKAALHFRAINHKLRQQILQCLHQKKEMVVSELFKKLRLEQSVASQHLAILRKARLVRTRRQGKFIFYSVNHERLAEVHVIAAKLIA